MLPVFESNNVAALLPGAVRGPGGVAEHLLHRRDHQPADRPGAGLPQGEGRQDALPGRQRLRVPAYREPDHQGVRGGQRHRDRGRGVRPARLAPTSPPSSTRSARPTPTPCSTPSTATPTWLLQGVQERRPDRRRRCRWSRCRSPRRRSAASASQNIAGQLTAWNYYQTIDTPENKKFVEAYKAKYGADKPTSDPMEAAYISVYLWKDMVEKAEVVRRRGDSGQRRRRHLRRARGPGHHRRREPPHHQDRPHRRDPRRRPDLHRLGLRQPDRARPVPQGLPLGRRACGRLSSRADRARPDHRRSTRWMS